MKAAKVTVLVAACIAMLTSLGPLFAVPPFRPDPNPGGGSGGSSWTVTCTYDASEHLISKSCTSGGSSSCSCP